jgi:protein-serine/threonine kinase
VNAQFARRALSDSGPCNFLVDILLHQSGHIMLSDFDLAKQSNEPSGMPTMVHSEHNGVSWGIVISCS